MATYALSARGRRGDRLGRDARPLARYDSFRASSARLRTPMPPGPAHIAEPAEDDEAAREKRGRVGARLAAAHPKKTSSRAPRAKLVSVLLSRAMTVGFVPAFDPKIAVTFAGDGAALFHHAAALDAIAEEHGLPLLSSFADDREPPPDFDGFPEDLAEALGPWTAWFSPTDGLRCVEGLLTALEKPEVRERITSIDAVLDDLSALQAVLLQAKKRKARFRLEVA